MLDAFESGRVEEVLVLDGATVAKGELLFRLSNPQLRLELVAREADRAQQISNLSILRVAIETSETEHQRRLLDLNFALTQARKSNTRASRRWRRKAWCPSRGARGITRIAWRAKRRRSKTSRPASRSSAHQARRRDADGTRHRPSRRRPQGGQSIDRGLAVRAPIAGRLTDFHLQLGEIVKSDQHIGRIDQPGEDQAGGLVDEFFLDSVSTGVVGNANVNGRDYPVVISRVFPQVDGGRFTIELRFEGEAPAGMSPGQSAETRLTLGEAAPD